MRSFKYLLRNITLLNIVLLAAIAVGVTYVFSPVIHLNPKFTSPQTKKAEAGKDEPAAAIPAPSPLDYAIIAEQNLFHPDRKIPVDKPAEAPLPKPDFVLYGVLITDDTTVAYMEDKKAPQSTTGRGKRQIALRKGESLSGFTVTAIEPTKVVMVRGEETETVNLNDQHAPKTREGGAPPAPGQPQPPTAGGQPAQAPQPGAAPRPVQQPPGTPLQPRTAAQPAQQAQQTPPASPSGDATPQSAKKTFLDFFKRGQ
ncbi:MAG: hypothetical protein ABR903_02050 [Thermodesulfovibrionales bacterium]|jgi:type II secretory pathway component PulC